MDKNLNMSLVWHYVFGFHQFDPVFTSFITGRNPDKKKKTSELKEFGSVVALTSA